MSKIVLNEEVENWVDIIREWHKDDPYPPIRPLAERIVQALHDFSEKLIGEVEAEFAGGGIKKHEATHRNDLRVKQWELRDKLLKEEK